MKNYYVYIRKEREEKDRPSERHNEKRENIKHTVGTHQKVIFFPDSATGPV